MNRSHQWPNNRIRPKVNETLANEDVESNEGIEEESEEARKIAGQKAIYQPTADENPRPIQALVSILRERQMQEQSTYAESQVTRRTRE